MSHSDTPWYKPNRDDPDDEAKRATHLVGETASIEQRQASWHELNLWNATLVFNRELPAFRWGEPVADWELQPVDLKTENLLESIAEALMSKASSSPLKPSLVPHGRRLEIERSVRIADDFVFGVWKQTEAEEAAVQMFLDAYVSGIGCVEVGYNEKTDQLHVAPIFFDNVIIDNRECGAGGNSAPRTYRIRRILPRAAVEAQYGKKLDGRTLETGNKYGVNYRSGCAEGWVVVIEAWRPGDYHMVACGDVILFEEKWKHDWVPLVFFHWTDHRSGFFGKSGVEQLLPYQTKQNDLGESIEKAIDLTCVPRLLLNANSMVDINQWDNEAGKMLLYSGIEPKPFEWRTDLLNLLNERERNWAKAFSHVGLSEQFAGADMPQQVRLDSSAGVREFHNMEDRRNLRRWSRFEKARMAIAKTIVRVLANEKGAAAFKTYYHNGSPRMSAIKIPYEALSSLSEDDYSWTMAATPLSAMSPAARREQLRDWTSRGLVEQGSDEARRMEGNPNLERMEAQEMASREDIDLRVLKILESGKYEPPTIFTNTVYGMAAVAANHQRLLTYEDVKPWDPRLLNHKRWVVAAIGISQQVLAMQQQQQPPAPPAAMSPFSPTQGMAGTNSSNGPSVMMQAPPQ